MFKGGLPPLSNKHNFYLDNDVLTGNKTRHDWNGAKHCHSRNLELKECYIICEQQNQKINTCTHVFHRAWGQIPEFWGLLFNKVKGQLPAYCGRYCWSPAINWAVGSRGRLEIEAEATY